MDLEQLIVLRRVGDRRLMKDRVKLLTAKPRFPVEPRHIRADNVAAKIAQVLKIPGPEVVDDHNPRLWKLLLQRQRQIGADKTGPAGDEDSV